MLEAIPITQARKNFLPLIKRVGRDLLKFIITRQGKPVAVVLSYEEYNRMVETLKVIKNDTLTREIREGLENIRQGRSSPWKDLFEDE